MLYSFEGRSPRAGKETYVSEHALVIGDVRIGDNCYIGHGTILRGDYGSIVIGNGTAVEEGVIIHAPPSKECTIGNRVIIGHGAIIHAAGIRDLSVIGMGAILSVYAEIGTNTVIAEGTIVKMRQVIPDNVVAGGNPARVIRKIAKKDVEYWTMAQGLYIDLAKRYLLTGMKPVS